MTDEPGRALEPVPVGFNEALIVDFRAHAGRVTHGPFAGRPILLLTTTDDDGEPRTVPLSYTRDGSDYAVLASYAGGPINPRWFRNLSARPEVTLEIGAERAMARALIVTGAARERLFALHATQMPQFIEYQERTSRSIPVVVLRLRWAHSSDG